MKKDYRYLDKEGFIYLYKKILTYLLLLVSNCKFEGEKLNFFNLKKELLFSIDIGQTIDTYVDSIYINNGNLTLSYNDQTLNPISIPLSSITSDILDEINNLSRYKVGNINYDRNSKKIYFYDNSSDLNEIGHIDTDDFIKDGMVSDVRLEDRTLIITFNTDSGKQDIILSLDYIFNPDNYYNKTETEELISQTVVWGSGRGTNSAILKGSNSNAFGNNSVAAGMGTKTFSAGEFACGKYNYPGGLFSIGFGTSSSPTDRKNAHIVDMNGETFLVNLGGYDGVNPNNSESIQDILELSYLSNNEIENLIPHDLLYGYIHVEQSRLLLSIVNEDLGEELTEAPEAITINLCEATDTGEETGIFTTVTFDSEETLDWKTLPLLSEEDVNWYVYSVSPKQGYVWNYTPVPSEEEPIEQENLAFIYINNNEIGIELTIEGFLYNESPENISITLYEVDDEGYEFENTTTVTYALGEELSRKSLPLLIQGYSWYVRNVTPDPILNVDWTYHLPPQPVVPEPVEDSERYLYISNGNLIARVIDEGIEAEVASEAFTVTLAAFIGEEEIVDTVQQVSFAVGDALSKEIEEPVEGDLYVTSVSPSSYDGMNWMWDFPDNPDNPDEPTEEEQVLAELYFDTNLDNNIILMYTENINNTYVDSDVFEVNYSVGSTSNTITDTLGNFADGVFVTNLDPNSGLYEINEDQLIIDSVIGVNTTRGIRYQITIMTIPEEEFIPEEEEE